MRHVSEARMLHIRQRHLDVLTHGLPALTKLPIPNEVISKPWFRTSGLAECCSTYLFEGGRIPTGNGKTPAAFEACAMDYEAGKFDDSPVLVAPTSANYGTALGFIALGYPVKGVWAIVDSSVPEGKLIHLRSSGAVPKVAPKGISPIVYAMELGAKPGYHLINQYTHPGTYLGGQYTMGHIVRELLRLGKKASIFAAVTGTCGTLVAADLFLRPAVDPGLKIFGVASMSKEEDIPGSRYPEKLAALKEIGGFSYENIIEMPLITSVTQCRTYDLNAELVQEHGFSVGPTVALLVAGYWNRIEEHWQNGTLDSLRNRDGEVVGVLYGMDMHLPYLGIPEYLQHFQT